MIEEGRTLGALSVAAVEESELLEEADLEMTFLQTVPLTTSPGVGTNLGNVWTTISTQRRGFADSVLVSPGGKLARGPVWYLVRTCETRRAVPTKGLPRM